MKHFPFAVALSLLLISIPLNAQEPPADPAVVAPTYSSTLDLNGDGKVDAEEIAKATDADADIGTTVGEGVEAVTTITETVKNRDKIPLGTMIAIILGAVFKLLLSLMKVLGKNIAWFKTKDGKRVVKYSTLGLGAAAALLANLAFGMHWLDAVQILLSGPLAVAIHEYTSDSSEPKSDDQPS
jgi:hypothetical protein